MSRSDRTTCLTAWTTALLVAFALDFQPWTRTAVVAAPPSDAKPAILRGRVTDETGGPLADVRVRVAIPAMDMRIIDLVKGRRQLETRTDAKGDYRFEIPELVDRTRVSLDATKPGYRRLVGSLMAGGDAKFVDVGPGVEAEASLVLRPALYLAGKVVDDHGQPIPSVEIQGTVEAVRGSGAIERTVSRPDGSFELFSYPLQAPALRAGPSRGVVYFSDSEHVDTSVDDLYKLTAGERSNLRVVLPIGCKVAGRVLDFAGKPVSNVLVKASRKDGRHRKATMTDAEGKFALMGLNPGLNLLSARSMAIKQRAEMPMALSGGKTDLEIRLQPIPLPANLETYTVLGMKLTDVTPELRDAYDLYDDHGVLILDPGKDADGKKIGNFAEGYVLWMVGDKRVGSVREFVEALLAVMGDQNFERYQVRVAYRFSRVDADHVTSTRVLQVTKEDLKALNELSDRLAPER
jgi:hypothetical protein